MRRSRCDVFYTSTSGLSARLIQAKSRQRTVRRGGPLARCPIDSACQLRFPALPELVQRFLGKSQVDCAPSGALLPKNMDAQSEILNIRDPPFHTQQVFENVYFVNLIHFENLGNRELSLAQNLRSEIAQYPLKDIGFLGVAIALE